VACACLVDKGSVWLGFWGYFCFQKAKSLTKGAAFGGYFFRSSCFFVVHFRKHLRPAFGFSLFEMGGIKNSLIFVLGEIKIGGIFYTCFNQTTLAFL
jgi:hypothetical protein